MDAEDLANIQTVTGVIDAYASAVVSVVTVMYSIHLATVYVQTSVQILVSETFSLNTLGSHLKV